MRFFPTLLLAGLASTAIAAPYPQEGRQVNEGEEVEDPNKINQAGQFDTPIELEGGDVQQDILFTKSGVGSLEVEFANNVGRTLTVTENKTPVAAPAGFKAIEPSSFKIDLAEGADGLTLTKVDFVFDPTSPDLAGTDISTSQIGKLCTDTNTFVIDAALGELEFEDNENEISLTTNNINGEWGIFIPDVAGNNAADNNVAGNNAADDNAADDNAADDNAADDNAADDNVAGNNAAGGNAGGDNAGGDNAADNNAADNNAADADAAGAVNGTANGEAANKEEEGGETDVRGAFDRAVSTPGGNQKTDILFPGSAAGALEVEVNATAANAVTVTAVEPTGNPPAGMIFVDPQAFNISTERATSTATDIVKVDYIFTQAILEAIDPTRARTGKLDTNTNTYDIDNVGEFEFEVDENEWSLTVPDLNGEWAFFVPRDAVL